MLRPASRQISTRRVAPFTSVSPHARKKSLPPPNVPVPRLNAGTLKPDPPSCLNSIAAVSLSLWCEVRSRPPRQNGSSRLGHEPFDPRRNIDAFAEEWQRATVMESATMEMQTCVDGRSCRRHDGPYENRTDDLRAQLLPLVVNRVHERRRGIDDSVLRVSPAIQIEIAQEPIGLVLRGNVIGIRLQPIVCREEAREPVGILFGLLGVQIALFEKLAAGCRAKTADAEFLLRIGGAGVIHGER